MTKPPRRSARVAAKRGLGVAAAGVLAAGCAASTSATMPPSTSTAKSTSTSAPPAHATAVEASCAALSPGQRLAMARLVFVGRMLPGASAPLDGRDVLGSPARVRVVRYIKGTGPRSVKVATAQTIRDTGTTVAEDGIEPQVGELWKIYTDSRRQPFATSICGGSTRIMSAPRVALSLWSGFPVGAMPRPAVLLGEGNVLDPSSGFPDDSAKIAFGEGRLSLGTVLPRGPTGPRRIVSAAAAYRALRAAGRPAGISAPPLVVRAVRLRSATFVTDRGRRRLPAWQFWFRRVDTPAAVLALGPPDVFTAPPLEQLGQPGPGNSIEDSARADRSGTRITISFIGSPPGTGPCHAHYAATAITDRRAVAFTIRTSGSPAPGTICTLVGSTRTVLLHLKRPLGARVLISSTDGGAVAVTAPAGQAASSSKSP